jgi:hypothetical protein
LCENANADDCDIGYLLALGTKGNMTHTETVLFEKIGQGVQGRQVANIVVSSSFALNVACGNGP